MNRRDDDDEEEDQVGPYLPAPTALTRELIHDGAAVKVWVVHVPERIKASMSRSLRLGKAAAYGDE